MIGWESSKFRFSLAMGEFRQQKIKSHRPMTNELLQLLRGRRYLLQCLIFLRQFGWLLEITDLMEKITTLHYWLQLRIDIRIWQLMHTYALSVTFIYQCITTTVPYRIQERRRRGVKQTHRMRIYYHQVLYRRSMSS